MAPSSKTRRRPAGAQPIAKPGEKLIGAPCSLMVNRGAETAVVKLIDRSQFRTLRDRSALVLDWHQRATEARSESEAFMFEWIALNGWGECVAEVDTDRQWVAAVAFDADLGRQFAALVAGDPEFNKRATDFAAYWPIFEVHELWSLHIYANRSGPPNRAAEIDRYRKAGATRFEPQCCFEHTGKPDLDWPHTLMAIYRVRNNLFHGGKAPQHETDMAIVRAAQQVLSAFIERAQVFTWRE